MTNKSGVAEEDLAAVAETIPAAARAAGEILVAQIPAYGPGVCGRDDMVRVEAAIRLALEGFLVLASRPDADPGAGPEPTTVEAAYEFGRYEAQHDRDMNALLAAYRVGARVAWRHIGEVLVERGAGAPQVAQFAELVFAYVDHLSAASVAGHGDEIAATTRALEHHRAQLAVALLHDSDPERLTALAAAAEWRPPRALAAAVVPAAHARPALQRLDHGTLVVPGDLAPGLADHLTVLLVPHAGDRAALVDSLGGHGAVLGPTRTWTSAFSSYARALRTLGLPGLIRDETSISTIGVVDTDDHLAELVITADTEALADLRAGVLAPLAPLRPAAAERLAETLRSWILHQGRREKVAADLKVHPQTVRYRMSQLRELFGDRLASPRGVLELTVTLAAPLHDDDVLISGNKAQP
ncbi:MAG TPA: helix-turn-helix domain-containing protein [Acidimicrobiales bacterium]|nr:helix-turn-helix domain-containing protein [Acidimicrobiales bacterium]